MSELKLCPHCKGTKIRTVTKRTKQGHYGDGLPAYHVTAYATCRQCYARGPVVSSARIPSTRTASYKAEVDALNDMAIAAWNRRAQPDHIGDATAMIAQPDNAPLTLDELRGMDGEPVYIVAHPDWGHWELSEDAEDYFEGRDEDFYGMTMPPALPDPMGKYGLHMLGWLAYRRKPEGGASS
jgi:hypothetical protein